jgi:protein SCO1/2
MNMSMKLRALCASCTIATLLIAASDWLSAASVAKNVPDVPRSDRSQATYRGGLITPPLAKPQFTLTDTSGTPFDFRLETQGYVTLLFFGYTHCPDACPLHMAALASGLRQVPENVRSQVKVVFVTADPVRDSSTVLRAWLNHFDTRFIGLTGDATTIEAAQRAARIPAASKVVLANKTYELAHASFVLAYTKDNRAHVIYPGGIAPRDWAHDLPLLANEKWSKD